MFDWLYWSVLLVLLVSPCMAQQPAGGNGSDVALSAVVIPTGFQERKFSAMIQIAVEGSPLPDTTWALGASFRAEGQDAQEFTGRVTAGEPGMPVVLEIPFEFPAGSFSLALTATETTAGQSGRRTLEDRWTDPHTEAGTISPIILLQPAHGAFVRGASKRTQGALALENGTPVETPLPTAVVSVVCRGHTYPNMLRIVRKLTGTRSVEFKTIHLLPREDQCAQVRDMIGAGTLGSGHYVYDVRLLSQDREIASASVEFAATAGAQPGP
jgi:hypothetical protein